MEFSTLNESDLHRSLKVLYSEKYNGNIEVQAFDHIYDILTEENLAIEIQTLNLAKLLPKTLDSIEKGLKVKIVHPVIHIKTIESYKDGLLISRRKSPKKGSIYSIFRELTGLYPVLLNPEFSLEIVIVNMIEQREKHDQAVQARNQRRRFRKDWTKANKKLDEILETRIFRTKEDYLSLLPEDLEKEFCAKDLKILFNSDKFYPAEAAKNANLILWVFSHMGIIQETGTRNRSKYYKIA